MNYFYTCSSISWWEWGEFVLRPCRCYSHCITFTSLPRGIQSPLVGACARNLLASSFPGSAGIQSSGFSSCSCNGTNNSPTLASQLSEAIRPSLSLIDFKLYLYESWRRFLVAASQETIWRLILSSCKINYFWSQMLFLNVADRWRDQHERFKLRVEFVCKLLRVLLLTMSPRVLSSALLGCAFLSLRDVCPDRVWMSCVFCSRLCPPFLLFFSCPTLS